MQDLAFTGPGLEGEALGPLLPGAPMGSARDSTGLSTVSLGRWDAAGCSSKRVINTWWCLDVQKSSGEMMLPAPFSSQQCFEEL